MASNVDPHQVAIDSASKLAGELYADIASPSAKRVGRALESLVKIGLSPVSLLDWGFESSKAWLLEKIEKRMSSTPDEHQQLPPSHKAVPLLLAISSCADAHELRSLYAELLLKSMDSRSESEVHPSFASVLGQMTPQEALVFMSFRSRKSESLFIDLHRAVGMSRRPSIERQFQTYCEEVGIGGQSAQLFLDNLLRLRLFEINTYTDATYMPENEDNPQPFIDTRDERHLTVTEYGHALLHACTPPSSA